MKTLTLALALVVTVAVLFPSQVDSECCRTKCANDVCEDCTKTTPCCGYKSCNIFCCACTCRTGIGCENCRNSIMEFIHNVFFGKEELKDKEVDHAADTRQYLNQLIGAYDQTGDGSLNLQEVQKWWSVENKGRRGVNVEAEFRKIDTDNDGKLTKREIDP